MKINYTKSGQPISDFILEEYLLDIKDAKSMINVSTENVILVARYLKIKGEIENLILYFEGKEVGAVDSDGMLDNWPDGFCDTIDNFLLKMIDGRMTK